jgi:multidrug efflux system outer membrane protein
MRAKRALLAVVVGSGFAVSGCSLAPAYHPPVVQAPVQYKEAAAPLPGWTNASPLDASARGEWWKAFNDALLDDLENRAAAASPTLAAALARYDQARAQVGVANASLLPEIDAGGQAARNRVSAHAPTNSLGVPVTYNDYVLQGTLSYEVDLWGRVRNTVKAARANAAASNDDLASARLSLQASVADAYIRLRGLDARADLLRRTVDAYKRAYDLTVARHQGGVAAGMDVSRARSTLSSALAQISDTANQRAATEHEIAALIGAVTADFTVTPRLERIALPPIPASQPSTLLQRRPDIAASERRMFSLNAQIGVARAALFPDLTLGLAGGFQTTAGALISAPTSFWSLGPAQLLTPIFDGGRRRAQVRLTRAQYDEAAADYRNTVLTAFRQVEDGLAALRLLADEEFNQRDAATSAQRTSDLALIRYRDGASDYLEVVTAQTDALTDEVTLINLQTQRLESNIALVMALGGEADGPQDAARDVRKNQLSAVTPVMGATSPAAR